MDRIEVGARLVRDGLRNEGLARPRRAIQEHALRRIDAEPLEQFRVLQRELDHLADFHQLLFQPANVLVRHGGREDLAFADRLFLHFDDRIVLDLHDAFRRGADDHERQGTAHERDPRHDDDIALVQGPLEQAALHEVLDSLTEGDLVTLADDRRDRDPFRGKDLGLPDLDLVPEAHANISTDEPVDPDDALALVLLHDSEELRGSRLLSDDLDDLSDVDA